MKTTKTGKLVKLVIYRHASEKVTVVDTIEADDWGDFLVVAMDLESLSEEEYNNLQIVFSEFSEKMQKQLILVPKSWSVEFYGVQQESG